MLIVTLEIDVKKDSSRVLILGDDDTKPEIFSGDIKAMTKFLKGFDIDLKHARPKLGGSKYDK
jgi:hypothetical protein